MWQDTNDKIARRIMRVLETEKHGDELTVAKVEYALQVMLDDSEKFFLLSLLFGLCRHLGEFYLAYAALGSLRRFMGGSHRKTMVGCLLSSLVNFGVILVLSEFFLLPVSAVGIVVAFLAVEIGWCTPLASPQQLHYTYQQRRGMRKKALAVLAFWGCAFPFLPAELGNIVLWALIFQGTEVLLVALYRSGKGAVVVQ